MRAAGCAGFGGPWDARPAGVEAGAGDGEKRQPGDAGWSL